MPLHGICANRYDGTASPGTRVFDVRIDGTPVLDDYDIAADFADDAYSARSADHAGSAPESAESSGGEALDARGDPVDVGDPRRGARAHCIAMKWARRAQDGVRTPPRERQPLPAGSHTPLRCGRAILSVLAPSTSQA